MTVNVERIRRAVATGNRYAVVDALRELGRTGTEVDAIALASLLLARNETTRQDAPTENSETTVGERTFTVRVEVSGRDHTLNAEDFSRALENFGPTTIGDYAVLGILSVE